MDFYHFRILVRGAAASPRVPVSLRRQVNGAVARREHARPLGPAPAVDALCEPLTAKCALLAIQLHGTLPIRDPDIINKVTSGAHRDGKFRLHKFAKDPGRCT